MGAVSAQCGGSGIATRLGKRARGRAAPRARGDSHPPPRIAAHAYVDLRRWSSVARRPAAQDSSRKSRPAARLQEGKTREVRPDSALPDFEYPSRRGQPRSLQHAPVLVGNLLNYVLLFSTHRSDPSVWASGA